MKKIILALVTLSCFSAFSQPYTPEDSLRLIRAKQIWSFEFLQLNMHEITNEPASDYRQINCRFSEGEYAKKTLEYMFIVSPEIVTLEDLTKVHEFDYLVDIATSICKGSKLSKKNKYKTNLEIERIEKLNLRF